MINLPRITIVLLILFCLSQWSLAGIHEAILASDSPKFNKMLSDDPRLISAKNRLGDYPLHSAAINGNVSIITFLLDKGAAVNAKAYDGSTPLHRAAEAGNSAAARLLITAGVEIDALNDRGESPLHMVALAPGSSSVEMAELLLKNKAKLELTDYSGNTPLAMAVSFLNEKLATFLISKNASLTTRNNQGETLLHLACHAQLRDKGVVDATSPLSMVKMLLAQGADIYAVDQNDFSLLHAVAATDNVATAEWLVATGVPIDARTETGATALHIAASWAHSEMVLRLIALGADVQAVDNFGRTPLHEVATVVYDGAEIATLKVLMGRFANINAQDMDGKTALHIAAENGYTRMVSGLLYYKADPKIKDIRGFTAAQWATNKGFTAIAEVLSKKP